MSKLSNYAIGSSTGQAVSRLATGLRLATVSLSSAQILSLFSSPIEVVPAPGVGKAIVTEGLGCLYLFGTTAYVPETDGDLTCGFYYQGGNLDTALMAFSPCLGASQSQYGFGLNAGLHPVADIGNKSILFSVAALDPMGGDGTAKLAVTYRVVDLTTGLFL